MMRELVMCGWNIGFDKILLTKTLRAEFGYSLLEGKSITDRVLAKEETRIPFNVSPLREAEFLTTLREIGVKASIAG